MWRILTLLLTLTSCATIINHKSYPLRITSDVPGSKVKIDTTSYALPALVKVNRSKEDLKISLVTDSSKTDYTVRSSPDPKFLFANLGFVTACPVAYLVDFTNPKRFYYGKNVFLSANSSSTVITPRLRRGFENYFSKDYPEERGNVYVTVSLPEANAFLLKPDKEPTKSSGGFLGLSVGLDYFYNDRNYFSVTASAISDFPFPFPVPLDRFGTYEQVSSQYFSITNNHKVHRFRVGYGASFSFDNWSLTRNDSLATTTSFTKKTNSSLGLVMNTYFQATRHLFVGVVYRPSFYIVSPTSSRTYQHVISFEVAWKFRLRR